MHSHFRKFYFLDIINIHHSTLCSTVAFTYLIIVRSLLKFINMQFLHSTSSTINLFYQALGLKMIALEISAMVSPKTSSCSPFDLSLQSGVATAYYLHPNHPVFNVCLFCTNFPHILLNQI